MRTLSLLTLILLTSGCGYHRRGSVSPLAKPASPQAAIAPTPEPAPAAAEVHRKSHTSVAREPDEREAHPDHALEALEFYRHMRMPGKLPNPPERYEAARRRAESMRQYSIPRGRFLSQAEKSEALSASSPQADVGKWQSLGPGNIGGRTRALLIHPTQP